MAPRQWQLGKQIGHRRKMSKNKSRRSLNTKGVLESGRTMKGHLAVTPGAGNEDGARGSEKLLLKRSCGTMTAHSSVGNPRSEAVVVSE